MSDPESTLAIDFGTTNSVVFVFKSGKLEAVPAGTYNTDEHRQGSVLFPSFVEYSTRIPTVGSAAKKNFGRNNKYVVAAVKRIIGLTYTEYENLQDKSIFGCEVVKGQDGYPLFIIDAESNTKSPVEVASEIFKVLKKEADAYTNRSYSKAYVTVPANFKDHQCRAIKEAAKLAGLEVLKLITEPTAAAMSWCFDHPDQIKSGEKMVVYDFGGGTFDVSLLQCFGPNQFCVLNTGGNPNLGGNDLDTALMNAMIEKVRIATSKEPKYRKREINRIRQDCEEAKIQITNCCKYDDDETVFLDINKLSNISIGSLVIDDSTSVDCTARDLNKAIDKYVDETVKITLDVIKHEKLQPEDIKYFLLVGGSSFLHLIRQRLHKKFTQAQFPVIKLQEVVARGAMSLLINDSTHTCQVKEKIVISYGLYAGNNEASLFLEKGTVIPAYSFIQPFVNNEDNQKYIKSIIYQWEGDPSTAKKTKNGVHVVPISECTMINQLSFENKYPKPKGKQKLAIQFKLDVGGTLEVICEDRDEKKLLASISYHAVYGSSK